MPGPLGTRVKVCSRQRTRLGREAADAPATPSRGVRTHPLHEPGGGGGCSGLEENRTQRVSLSHPGREAEPPRLGILLWNAVEAALPPGGPKATKSLEAAALPNPRYPLKAVAMGRG